jgi:hypothetical protein
MALKRPRSLRGFLGILLSILVLGPAFQVQAGGRHEPPPYAMQEVGPVIAGDLTLVPGADNMSFVATLKGACGKKKVTVTANLYTVQPADTFLAQTIQADANNYHLKAGSFKIKGACKAASGPGDLMVKSLTGLQKKGKKGQWTAKATLTFIVLR